MIPLQFLRKAHNIYGSATKKTVTYQAMYNSKDKHCPILAIPFLSNPPT